MEGNNPSLAPDDDSADDPEIASPEAGATSHTQACLSDPARPRPGQPSLRTDEAPLQPGNTIRWGAAAEVGLILLLFFISAGGSPPDVNEAHYLSKARHYWDPGWCPNDLFLESADAHLVFYWTVGWLTLLLPLAAVAWIGRFLTWLLLAWCWRRLSFAVVPRPLFAVLTAALFLPLQSWCDMAGEWVVGGFEAKGFAYALVLLGLEALVRNRWNGMWVLFGAASSFHVLVGGWSVAAGAVAWIFAGQNRFSWRRMLPGLLLGGVLALPGLLPTLALNVGQDAEVVQAANQIYVLHRLPHHLVLSRFPLAGRLAFAGLLLVWAGLVWTGRRGGDQTRLDGFITGSLILAAVGSLMSVAPQYPWFTGLLRFYWFRLADAALPLGVSLALGNRIAGLLDTLDARRRAAALCAALLLPALFLVQRTWQHQRDPRPAAERQTRGGRSVSPDAAWNVHEDWVRACHWIGARTPPDAVFITPRQQQTFHWYAQRAEVACWKDVPQDAGSLVRWWNRMEELYPDDILRNGLAQHGSQRLIELARNHGAQYILLDRRRGAAGLDLLRVYPNQSEFNASFEVYRVPPTPEAGSSVGGDPID